MLAVAIEVAIAAAIAIAIEIAIEIAIGLAIAVVVVVLVPELVVVVVVVVVAVVVVVVVVVVAVAGSHLLTLCTVATHSALSGFFSRNHSVSSPTLPRHDLHGVAVLQWCQSTMNFDKRMCASTCCSRK